MSYVHIMYGPQSDAVSLNRQQEAAGHFSVSSLYSVLYLVVLALNDQEHCMNGVCVEECVCMLMSE